MYRYLHENESFSKTILACLSEAQVGGIHGEKKCHKILWHCHFKRITNLIVKIFWMTLIKILDLFLDNFFFELEPKNQIKVPAREVRPVQSKT